MYGLKNLQSFVRRVSIFLNKSNNYIKLVNLTNDFHELLKSDDRLEIVGKVRLSLVCFRLKVFFINNFLVIILRPEMRKQ